MSLRRPVTSDTGQLVDPASGGADLGYANASRDATASVDRRECSYTIRL